jgi:hypothetical protein
MSESDRQTEQQIVVFQQCGSGEAKILGIRDHGRGLCISRVIDIDEDLPRVIDDTDPYLPASLEADLVLDFLRHPDLRYELALRCLEWSIPVVASGKRVPVEGLFTPPT